MTSTRQFQTICDGPRCRRRATVEILNRSNVSEGRFCLEHLHSRLAALFNEPPSVTVRALPQQPRDETKEENDG